TANKVLGLVMFLISAGRNLEGNLNKPEAKVQTRMLATDYTDSVPIRPFRVNLWPMFNPQPLHYRPLESRANLFAD
ncbi:MAG TPA: hypothetical protein VGC73_01715, partial [Pyrinomonadaceae bacterium]